jgi:hypothetical protein
MKNLNFPLITFNVADPDPILQLNPIIFWLKSFKMSLYPYYSTVHPPKSALIVAIFIAAARSGSGPRFSNPDPKKVLDLTGSVSATVYLIIVQDFI